ncbi:hypothetical protein PC116_g8996 [Phytophthora cactorum]|uniref:Uncharacterized protein n=1 Tax=Phytophthora cactorum TaxID=29920 RepID=A0A8T1D1N2_9STRA|nr:hypothetical protein PC112_g6115 [Phytophthora cactorum]KAG2836175.1 hypothetical protein PC111_g5145 [Phytophthora cactorum]KAG2933212.1 hypothetical protein PC115_g5548 [Phytophthora cactorum]KAG3028776.1 hypothetical protein PC120_g4685 [Phytophthora cactorum]KAG4060234.1 hypothetical protein PC123_g4869 [Phytophthora cactorum]
MGSDNGYQVEVVDQSQHRAVTGASFGAHNPSPRGAQKSAHLHPSAVLRDCRRTADVAARDSLRTEAKAPTTAR